MASRPQDVSYQKQQLSESRIRGDIKTIMNRINARPPYARFATPEEKERLIELSAELRRVRRGAWS